VNHFFDEIQGWFNFKQPYRDAVREASDGSVLVELGCWKGKSAAFLLVEALSAGKTPEVHFVDHWGGSNEQDHKADPELQRVFDIFLSNIGRADYPKATVHRKRTVEAADDFAPDSVDFIWVDAGHEYDEVMADLRAWWPKLRVGGVMGGDDLPMKGVNKAVSEFFPTHEVGSENGWQWWRVRKKG
jgi:cephalosporin hydroxylase